MSEKYEMLRQELIAWLKELELARRRGKLVAEKALEVDGELNRDVAALMKMFDQFMEGVLKLEQETREI